MDLQVIKVGFDNCYLIRDEGTILVDGGMPGHFRKFRRGLQRKGIAPRDIGAVVITHCHWDHFGCAQKIKQLTGAKLIVHKAERQILEKGTITMPPGVTRWGKILGAFLKMRIRHLVIEPVSPDIVVDDEDYSLEEFGVNGRIVFTPGHSPGSVSVVLDSGAAFVGDMAMNGPPLTLHPSLPIFAEDMAVLKKSWRKLADRGVTMIYPAHGNHFPLEKLLRKAAF
ncbi:MAG: MBL fold metallo-hydrolase [FCB group bacterium]|nr:MBL fold metallo-hydrolase [FCB group bacterium]